MPHISDSNYHEDVTLSLSPPMRPSTCILFPSRGQEEKETTEDEMAGWHHRLNGHEFQ